MINNTFSVGEAPALAQQVLTCHSRRAVADVTEEESHLAGQATYMEFSDKAQLCGNRGVPRATLELSLMSCGVPVSVDLTWAMILNTSGRVCYYCHTV